MGKGGKVQGAVFLGVRVPGEGAGGRAQGDGVPRGEGTGGGCRGVGAGGWVQGAGNGGSRSEMVAGGDEEFYTSPSADVQGAYIRAWAHEDTGLKRLCSLLQLFLTLVYDDPVFSHVDPLLASRPPPPRTLTQCCYTSVPADVQEAYIRDWARKRTGLDCNFRISFYPGRYAAEKGGWVVAAAGGGNMGERGRLKCAQALAATSAPHSTQAAMPPKRVG